MIYLFRKRNGTIIATSGESAYSMYTTPRNFVTHQPEYLGAVQDNDFRAISDKSEEEVPFKLETLVNKNGEKVVYELNRFQIQEAIQEGDKGIESRFTDLQKQRTKRYNELLEELIKTADRRVVPPSFNKRIGAIDDVVGDPSHALVGYKSV